VRWIVPSEQPQIATADGGVIGQSGITYDSNGNATGQVAMPTYSWFGNAYQVGSVDQIAASLLNFADSFWAFVQGNASRSGTANRPLAKTVQQLVAQKALGYVNSTKWVGEGVSCNLFVKQVLEDSGQAVPLSIDWRSRARYLLGRVDTPYYPALAGEWASPSTTLGCWHNVTVPSDRLGGYPASMSQPGDVIGEAINHINATGHVGIVVGPEQTASADSAAACMSLGVIPAEIIDITNYGFRADGAVQVNPDGQVCSTTGWKSKLL
jgi:hypothetical protein